MKACLVLQGGFAKIAHAITINLKEHSGINEFSAYVMSPQAEDLIARQNDIKYDPIIMDYKLHESYEKEKIDLAYIRNFEKTYPPNLWQYFYGDRKLMMSIGPKEDTTIDLDPLYSHNDLLKIFQVRAKAIEDYLRKDKPDFIVFFAMGSLGHMILYHVAKKMNIKTLNIDLPRIGNLVSLSDDYMTISGVEKKNKSLLANTSDSEQEMAARTQAANILEKFKKTGLLGLEQPEILYEYILKKNSWLKISNLKKSIKYYGFNIWRDYIVGKNVFQSGNISLNPFLLLSYRIKEKYRARRNLSALYSPPDFDEDYAFYPLHVEPELSILLLSPFYYDQLALLRQISKSLPLHFKLYVKEHPGMTHKRPKKFYKELLKIPNVKLIDHKIPTNKIIRHAKLITTITGTVGWEASLLGKPVITFGGVFYNALSFVKRAHDIEKLPELIKKQLNDFAFDEKELVNFIAAMLLDSVPMNLFKLWYESDLEKIKNDEGVKNFCKLLIDKVKNDA